MHRRNHSLACVSLESGVALAVPGRVRGRRLARAAARPAAGLLCAAWAHHAHLPGVVVRRRRRGRRRVARQALADAGLLLQLVWALLMRLAERVVRLELDAAPRGRAEGQLQLQARVRRAARGRHERRTQPVRASSHVANRRRLPHGDHLVTGRHRPARALVCGAHRQRQRLPAGVVHVREGVGGVVVRRGGAPVNRAAVDVAQRAVPRRLAQADALRLHVVEAGRALAVVVAVGALDAHVPRLRLLARERHRIAGAHQLAMRARQARLAEVAVGEVPAVARRVAVRRVVREVHGRVRGAVHELELQAEERGVALGSRVLRPAQIDVHGVKRRRRRHDHVAARVRVAGRDHRLGGRALVNGGGARELQLVDGLDLQAHRAWIAHAVIHVGDAGRRPARRRAGKHQRRLRCRGRVDTRCVRRLHGLAEERPRGRARGCRRQVSRRACSRRRRHWARQQWRGAAWPTSSRVPRRDGD
mmetsp:Transcript_12943/g.45294  ORF Transcript_12943/g.45294 Transcript_12943/m.45294 type:complete len:475 (+) Transcript_12943:763-2187(+)